MFLAWNLTLFFILQVAANLFFKWGSTLESRYWWGFAIGNILGASSIMFLINIYKSIESPNVAMAISSGATFILVQVFMSLVFKSPLNFWQYAGIALIVSGVVLMSLFSSTT